MSPWSRTWVWQSIRPGRTVAFERSMTATSFGAALRMSSVSPTDLIRSPSTRICVVNVEVQFFQRDLVCFNLGKVQDVVDESEQRPSAVLRHVGVFLLLRVEIGVQEQLQHA